MKLGYKSILYLIVLTMLSLKPALACIPQINWGASVSFCQGNSFTLNAANPNSTYVWSTGAATPSISVSQSGTYWVTVSNMCGSTSDTIQVIVDTPVALNLGKDRSICSGSSITLSAPFSPSSSYMWQNGYTGNQLNVSQAGTYHVSVTNACGTYRDTVVISIDQPQTFSLGADVVNCTSNTSTLQLPAGINGTVKWSTGHKTNSITVNQSGTYWVKVTNACGIYSDTVDVDFVGPGNLFPSDTILFCNSGLFSVSSPVSIGTFLWSNNATTSSIQVTQSGKYWLTLSLPCGTFSDTVYLIGATASTINLGSNVVICDGTTTTLDAGNPGSNYTWSTGATSQSIVVDSTASYWVGVDNGCGWVYDTVDVFVQTGPVNTVDDTVYACQNGFGTANAGSWGPNTTYLWSNQSTSQVNTSLTVGLNWVKVMNPCDTVFKTFHVKSFAPTNLNLGKDTTFCGKTFVIFSHIPKRGNTFLWSQGNTTQNFTANKTGTYWLRVTNACGVFYDTIRVNLVRAPGSIARDTIYKCPNQRVKISTSSRTLTTYNWSTGSKKHYAFVSSPGTYTLMAYNICDTLYDTVHVVDKNIQTFTLGKDTTFCSPAKLTLNLVGAQVDSVLWKGVAKRTSVTLRSSGRYWVKIFSPCGVYYDTINVKVNKPADKRLNDTSYCGFSSVLLDVTQPQAISYNWSTGDTSSSIHVSSIGWYYVDINTLCGITRDSVFVNQVGYLPQINIGKDTLYCSGQLTLDPGAYLSSHYLWSTGDTVQSITVNKTGTYYVKVSNGCGSVYDTINVVVTGPPIMTLGNSVKFCAGSTLNLNAQNPGCTYLWSNGDTASTLAVTQPGKYWVTITNNCGSLVDTIDVIVENPLQYVSLGNDTIICRGDSLELNTLIPGVFTQWNTGSFLPSIIVTKTGDYWVEVSNSCGAWSDTIHVEVLDVPGFSLGNDTAICAFGGSLQLEGPDGMGSYMWQDGSTNTGFLVTQYGKYWLTVNNGCFSYTDTIIVDEDFPIDISLGNDTTLCSGESLSLNPNIVGAKMKWSDNSTSPVKSITETGMYWVSARNSCGTFSDTIEITFEEKPNLERVDTLICSGDTAVINVANMGSNIRWFDGSTDTIREFAETGMYNLTVTNTCGDYTKSYFVEAVNCECPFFVPNAFTPNDDGLNDEFKIGHSCPISSYSMQVYNRWGQVVFESSNPDIGWDGTAFGTEAATGIYSYKISYVWYVYGVDRSKEHTGTLTLMR